MVTYFGWGSRDAEGMFRIAIHVANFDPKELMKEIHRLSPKGAKVKVSTVLQAMQNVKDRHDKEHEEK